MPKIGFSFWENIGKDMPLKKVLNIFQTETHENGSTEQLHGSYTPKYIKHSPPLRPKLQNPTPTNNMEETPQEKTTTQKDETLNNCHVDSPSTNEEEFTILPAITVDRLQHSVNIKPRNEHDLAVSHNQNGSIGNSLHTLHNGDSVMGTGGPFMENDSAVVSIVVDEQEPPKKEVQRNERFDRMTLLSALYAVILVSIGLVFPVTEAIQGTWFTSHVVGSFMVYLYSASVVFLLYLNFFNLPRSAKMAAKHHDPVPQDEPITPKTGDIVLRRRRSSAAFSELPGDGTHTTELGGDHSSSYGSLSPDPLGRRKSVFISEGEAMEYINLTSSTASLSHEGTSFYLRLGAVAFGIGNLIFVILNIEYYLGGHLAATCSNRQLVYPMFFHIVFILVQTLFLFKHSRIRVELHKPLVRFGLMHVLATNLCVWLRVLVEEVKHGVHDAEHDSQQQAASTQGYSSMAGSSDMLGPSLYAAGDNNSCLDKKSLLKEATPYLFPLVLEYSLIALATMYAMASEVVVHVSQDVLKIVKETLKRRKKEEMKILHNIQSISQNGGHMPVEGLERGSVSSQEHEEGEIQFEKAHIGLLFGIIVLAGMVTGMIIFFHANRTLNDPERAQMTYQVGNLVFHVILLVAVVIAAIAMFKLAYSYDRHNTIDDGLLVLAMLATLIYKLFVIISEINYISEGKMSTMSSLSLAGSIFAVLQLIIQTWFIMDGLHRYSSTEAHRTKKPGRGLVTFLIITNLGMWAYKTFQVKDTGIARQQEFFGTLAWSLIMNITLPLMLFYRFHSTVCLADIWHAAYTGEHGH